MKENDFSSERRRRTKVEGRSEEGGGIEEGRGTVDDRHELETRILSSSRRLLARVYVFSDLLHET